MDVLHNVYEQQKYMYDHKTHSVEDRIVSVSQPHVCPIVRGKVRTSVEFGAKLSLSLVDGFGRVERLSFDAYNESEDLVGAIERYKTRFDIYPERVLVDKIYRNHNNLAFYKERNIRLSGPRLGRPPADVRRLNAKMKRIGLR